MSNRPPYPGAPRWVKAFAVAAVVMVVLVLNVYKPRGMTRYGWRREEQRRGALPRGKPNDRRAV